MGFSLNPEVAVENAVKAKVASLVAKIEGIDADKDGVADITEIKQKLADAEAKILPVIEKLKQEAVIAKIEQFFEGLLTAQDLSDLATGYADLVVIEQHAVGMLPAVKADLS